MSDKEMFEKFIQENSHDLQVLGLFFLGLLRADLCVMSPKSSPVSVVVMTLSQQGSLGMKKTVGRLVDELKNTGAELITDGCGGSILRL